MAGTNIGASGVGDLSNAMSDFSVPSEVTVGAGASKELSYLNSDWSVDFGYYLNIPEFKRAVDTKVLWTVGAGFESDDPTTMLLDSIKGNGKDSFNGI